MMIPFSKKPMKNGDDATASTVTTTTKAVSAPRGRRGGVLFQNSTQYSLQPVKYTEATKGILKVASLEDSLLSCLPALPQEQETKRRSSFNLDALTTSIRNLVQPAPRDCASCGYGMDLADASEAATLQSSTGSLPIVDNSKVRFSEINIRLYPVAADDNPSATGKGAAIALSGWNFTTEDAVAVDDYEATRGPRRPFKDLKIDVMERRRRLLEAGISSAEIQAFARSVEKARLQRLETKQSLSLYGQSHMVRLERRERIGRFFERAFGLRKTNSKTQAALWDQAQEVGGAAKKTTKQSRSLSPIRRTNQV